MRPRALLTIVSILAALAAAICLPPVLDGLAEIRQARAALAGGDPARAAGLFAAAAEKLPGRADLWEQAGLASLQAGQPQQALAWFERAGQRLSPAGHIGLGDAYLALGDEPAAMRIWLALPADAAAYERLAGVYARRGDRASEVQALRDLLALRPEDARARYRLALLLALDDPSAALAHLSSALGSDASLDAPGSRMQLALQTALISDDQAYRCAVIGQAYGAIGEWELAVEAFEAALGYDPDYAEAWAWLGEAREQSGRDGLSALGRALELDPDLPVAYVLAGLYWSRHDRPELALERLRRAVELEPRNPAWYAALGDAAAAAGDLIAALEAYRQAIALAPYEPQYLYLLADFSLFYENDVQNIALPAAQRALELAPDDPTALELAGRAYLALWYPDESEQSLLRAIELDPQRASPHYYLGLLYLRLGRSGAARAEWILARDLADPQDPLRRQAEQLLNAYFP